jgi:hypothetical protein
MKTVLHIGLPKTGTTFLQQKVFSSMEHEGLLYNPNPLMKIIKKYFDNKVDILKVKIELGKLNANTLFLSEEGFSVQGYSFEYGENLLKLKSIFPDASIILFFRYQPDWLLSMYKQSIHQQNPQTINEFLNYKNDSNTFGSEELFCDNRYESVSLSGQNNLPRMNIHSINYAKMIQEYMDAFGENNVHIFFYEHLKIRKNTTLIDIYSLLGIQHAFNRNNRYSTHYRSLSSAAITSLIVYDKIALYLGLKVPYDDFNLNARCVTYCKLCTKIIHKLYKYIYWVTVRDIWQKYLDKLYYVDVDLLKKYNMRKLLDKYAVYNNQELLKFMPKEKIPDIYLTNHCNNA